MRRTQRVALIALILLAGMIFVPVAAAHPLGNFTINHYAGILAGPDSLRVDYVLDMAEIPAFQEIATFDANHNGAGEAQETAAYHPKQCRAILAQLSLALNNRPLRLNLESSGVEFPPGQGGLATLRLSCTFQAAYSTSNGPARLAFKDNSYPERLGWREIVVNVDGVSLNGDVQTASLSQRLTAYPQDLLSNPLDQRQVEFTIQPLGAASQAPEKANLTSAAGLPGDRNDAFTRLILLDNLDLGTLVFALAVSFLWGAMHALTPGHGKTIVGAYLVGSRGTARHALYLGLATTITHTAGVFALGLVTLFAAHFILPEKLFPWISLLSGFLVVTIGLNLFVSRLRGAQAFAAQPANHRFALQPAISPQTQYQVLDLQVGARQLVHSVHTHTGSHEHSHTHNLLEPHEHPHGSGHTHSHLPPGAGDTPLTWRSLLALGISGGILPCPSALVVLLSAIALDRIGFGLVLVVAFSLGLASVLTGIGLMFVYAGRLFERVPSGRRLTQLIPALSAVFIALIGLGITVRAMIEMGWIRL